MSGIVGLFDPAGPAPHLVEAAAAKGSAHRGQPLVKVIGSWVIGTLAREDESGEWLAAGDWTGVADARIDATMPGSDAALLGGANPGVSFLASVLRQLGA